MMMVRQVDLSKCAILNFKYAFPFISDATVGLLQSSYTVNEGNQDLMICVFLSGEFEREVVVSIGTEDGSALGEL